ncbi:MAG TPA: type 4a pilus biogenesis protein PilO [Candidatus Acidoferrum sp.]|nr:type 4a pilus biogenesis protein PilO [Candidatus Acidoferrum sp.]
MRPDFTIRKKLILGGVILLVLADVGLAAYSWQLTSAPNASQPSWQLKMLQKDIESAQKIREEMPKTTADCDAFEKSLFPASSGYSTVSAELGNLAKKSGIQLEALSFKPTDMPNRGLKEVAAELTVTGNYKNVIQFLNGVQRSTHYEVESLILAAGTGNQASSNVIKVVLHIKTYFRAAA